MYKDPWYQEATINGIPVPTMPHKDSARKRWNTYIKPLLPKERGIALDLGCNAGFYCRELNDLGFSSIGMDLDIQNAFHWENAHPKKILYIKGNILDWDFPYGVLALAACVIYWQSEHEAEEMVERLRNRVANVILMNRIRNNRKHEFNCDLKNMKRIFKLWEMGNVIEKGMHYSVIFHNKKIFPMKVSKLYKKLNRSVHFKDGFAEIVNRIRSGIPIDDPENSKYYRYLWRKGAEYRYKHLVNLVKNIMENGILEPIKVCNGNIHDGVHRIVIAKELGIDTVLCEELTY